jgi:hypothetical protein
MQPCRAARATVALCLVLAGAACSDAPEAVTLATPDAKATPGSAAARSEWVAAQLPPAGTLAGPAASPRAAILAPGSTPASVPDAGYAFIGKWSDGGKTFVYLQRGPHTLRVSAPGPLDAQYAVQSMDAHQLVLVHQGQGTRRVINLDAEPQTASARASPVSAESQLPPPVQAPSSEAAMPDN